MNFRIIHFFTLLLVIAATPSLLPAAEVYMWEDEKGVRHVTDQPPEKPAKMIGQERYKKDSPEEIRHYQREQKLKEYENDQELERRRQINRANESAEKLRDALKDRSKEYEKQRKEQARRDIDDLNAAKDRQRQNENDSRSNSRDDYWQKYWRDQQRLTDREIQGKQKILDGK